MYSYKQRIKAVKLYNKYGKKITPVIRELGYPNNRHTLAKWVKEYDNQGELKQQLSRKKIVFQEKNRCSKSLFNSWEKYEFY